MSKLAQAARHKRFDVKPGTEVHFSVQGPSGKLYAFKILNMSLSGIAAEAEEGFEVNEMLSNGLIFPAAKINIEKHEFALGRLALRKYPEDWAKSRTVGFSLIDTRLPLQGQLAHYLTIHLDDHNDPHELELSPGRFNLSHFAESEDLQVDLFAKTRSFSHFHQEWVKTPKYGYFKVRQSGKGSRIHLTKTRKNGRNDFISMGSNDYLGLAAHPLVEEAARNALKEFGFGSTGSPISTGMSRLHEELQDTVARIFKMDNCILFNSGYAANLGLIDGIMGAQDLIVADMISHASIQDAMRMARGTKRFFKHNDVKHLDGVLTAERQDAGGCLVVTEGVFSMDGDVPPLANMFKTSREHNARIMVDEAHSFGVLGEKGIGATEEAGLLGKVDIIMGTFSKVCGGIGGFICAEQNVIDWLKYFSRPFMFSVSIPPSTAAAALAALKIFESDKDPIYRLKKNIKQFNDGLRELGFEVPTDHRSSVIPVRIGNEEILGAIHLDLVEAGIYVLPIVYPVVSRKACRFRFTMTAELTSSDIDYAIMVLKQSMERHGFNPKNTG